MEKDRVLEDIQHFERRRLSRMLLQASAGLLAGTLLGFPLLSLAEYFFYLPATSKILFLSAWATLVLVVLCRLVILPWWRLKNTRSLPQFELLSREISARVSSVDDALVNYLQMLALSLRSENRLISLSLSQKQNRIAALNLPSRMEIAIPRGLWKYLIPPALGGILLLLFFYEPVKEGSGRLLQANKSFVPPAPFEIVFPPLPEALIAGKTFQITAETKGRSLPVSLYVMLGPRSFRMNGDGKGKFSIDLEAPSPGKTEIRLYAGNVSSLSHLVTVFPPGHIRSMKISVLPPAYTGRSAYTLENEGNLEVEKGSRIEWNLESEHLQQLKFQPGNSEAENFKKSGNGFRYHLLARQPVAYKISSLNLMGQPDLEFSYQISIREDEHPRIQVRSFQDSVSMSKMYYAGNIADDYGFSRLSAILQDPSSKTIVAETRLGFSRGEKTGSFVFSPEGKMAELIHEKPLLLLFKVWDNDAVSGPKVAASQIFDVKEASKEALAKSTDQMDARNEEKMEELVKKTQSLEKNSKKMLENLKGKKELNWQDKKELENFAEKQKDLFKQIEDLKKEAEKALKNKQENEIQSQELLEKQEQINKMLEELLDEKTKEMLKELQQLLEKQEKNPDKLQDAFEKMQEKNEFIQNELDRAMEMLKQLKVEEKLDKAIKDIEKLAEKENKTGEENEKKGNQGSEEQKEKGLQEQKEMDKMFQEVKEDLKQMQELNKELKDKNDIDTGEQEQKEIDQEQQNSSEQMKQGKMSKAGGSQKKAAQKMKKMAEKMKESMMEMQGGGADQEDIGDLRAIIENLLQLSFDQEEVYKQVSVVNQLEPKYLALSQKQVKIKDDSEIIKDSLKVLAQRAPQIQSFVMKELFEMDAAIKEAVKYTKARRPDLASIRGQLSMTHINNLTVMLKDALEQMQQQQQQQGSGSKSCKKPGKGKPKPGSMGQMQKQLNDQISQLKNGKKPGQQLSKELAQLAQKQAAMRRALAELEKAMQRGKEKSGGLGDVKSLMEKTERDLLNKKLTPETIQRQQQILTRLLESEKALMEREQDQRREAEKPKSKERTTLPAEIRELLKKSQAQKEQLMQSNLKLMEDYQNAFDKYIESLQENGL
jgi:hypothetical protein